MSTTILLHNPRCSKSRAALALLEERGVPFEAREYLQRPLSRAELEQVGRELGLRPIEFARTKESAWGEAGLGADASDDAVLDALAAHPVLMERPILRKDGRAVVGRPPERVLELLD